MSTESKWSWYNILGWEIRQLPSSNSLRCGQSCCKDLTTCCRSQMYLIKMLSRLLRSTKRQREFCHGVLVPVLNITSSQPGISRSFPGSNHLMFYVREFPPNLSDFQIIQKLQETSTIMWEPRPERQISAGLLLLTNTGPDVGEFGQKWSVLEACEVWVRRLIGWYKVSEFNLMVDEVIMACSVFITTSIVCRLQVNLGSSLPGTAQAWWGLNWNLVETYLALYSKFQSIALCKDYKLYAIIPGYRCVISDIVLYPTCWWIMGIPNTSRYTVIENWKEKLAATVCSHAI